VTNEQEMTMRTAIFTTEKTALTIQTTEALQLLQMSSAAQTAPPVAIALQPGANKVVVGPGVFKVTSNGTVGVTAGTQPIHVMSTGNDKDSGWPDPPMSTQSIDQAALHAFFVIAGARSL
jgi:hypothetical protein